MPLSKNEEKYAASPVVTGGDPLATGILGYSAFGDRFGAGKTEQQRGALNLQLTGDDTIDKYINQINSKAGVGTFNEGQFNAAKSVLDDLSSQLKAGKINQGEFARISGSFLPQLIDYGNQIASGGSKAASAVNPTLAKLNQHNANYNVYKTGQELLGRDLTPEEFAQALPNFTGPNGDLNGRAWLANYAQQYKQTPAYLATQAGKYGGQVNDLLKGILGRDATSQEQDYYGRMLATNQISPYEIQQQIKATPEFQTQQDTSFRKGLAGELEGYDVSEFGKEKQNIQADYARRGIDAGASPSLDYALTDLMGKIAQNRQSYLAQLSSQQYGGNKEAARQDYLGNLQNFLGNQAYNRQLGQQQMGYYQQRQGEQQDYQQQMSDYMNFLNNQPKQKSSAGAGALAGAGQGAGIGAGFGPWGALIGGVAGGAYGYLSNR